MAGIQGCIPIRRPLGGGILERPGSQEGGGPDPEMPPHRQRPPQGTCTAWTEGGRQQEGGGKARAQDRWVGRRTRWQGAPSGRTGQGRMKPLAQHRLSPSGGPNLRFWPRDGLPAPSSHSVWALLPGAVRGTARPGPGRGGAAPGPGLRAGAPGQIEPG